MSREFITQISSMKKQQSTALSGIRLIIFSLMIFAVPCCGENPIRSEMEEKLKLLEYSYSLITINKNDFFVIKGGKNAVFITKNASRDINRDIVCYYVFTTWKSVFLSDKDLKTIHDLNLKNKLRRYELFKDANRVRVLCTFRLSKDFSQTDLSKVIKECSEVKFPVEINQSEQYRLSIQEVLNKVFEAQHLGENKKIAQRISKIDMSFCPRDFYYAMEKYYNALQFRLGATEAGAALADDPVTAFILIGYGTFADAALEAGVIRESFQQVLQVAKKYGVEVQNNR